MSMQDRFKMEGQEIKDLLNNVMDYHHVVQKLKEEAEKPESSVEENPDQN
jgi:hypothetical protein